MWRVYRAYFRATVAIQLQYRIALLIWLLGLVVQPLIYLVVWSTVAREGSVGGYTAADFAAYYLILMLVNHATFTWIMWEYDFEVRQGRLSAKLLKPLNPIHIYLADNISYKLLTLSVVLPVFGLLSWYFRPSFSPTFLQIAAFIPVLILAFCIRWLVEYTLALAAFWTTRVSAFNQLYQLLMWFLSGYVAPNSLLPDWLRVVASILPFRWTVGFPVEVFLGRLDNAAIVQGLLIQCLWVGGAYVAHRVLWQIGLRRFSAVGA